MQKDNFRKDHKRKALVGCVGLLVFVFAMRVWPPDQTKAQIVVVPAAPIIEALTDTSTESEKAALKEENRLKDSTNLSLAKKVNRATEEVNAITSAKKKRIAPISLSSKELIYVRKDGDIVFAKPIAREGKFLIIDWNAMNNDIARIEAISDVDTAGPVQLPKVLTNKPKAAERTKLGQLIYNATHPFKKSILTK